MTAVINIGAGELTVGQLGEQAAQAVRALAYLTRPGLGALAGPADAAELIAALARASAGLPQLTSRPGQTLPAGRARGPLGGHHALLLRLAPPRDRRLVIVFLAPCGLYLHSPGRGGLARSSR